MGWLGDRVLRAIRNAFVKREAETSHFNQRTMSAKFYAQFTELSTVALTDRDSNQLLIANAHDAIEYMFNARGVIVHSFSSAERELSATMRAMIEKSGSGAVSNTSWATMSYLIRSAVVIAFAEAVRNQGESKCPHADRLMALVVEHCTFKRGRLYPFKVAGDQSFLDEDMLSRLHDAAFKYMCDAYLRLRPIAYMSWYSTAPAAVQTCFPSQAPKTAR